MKKRLTKTAVAALQKAEREYVVWDEDITGLHVRVLPSGSKTWAIKYRTKSGKTGRKKIGDATLVTPERARVKAREVLEQVADGIDPVAAERAMRNSPTLAALWDKYLKEYATLRKGKHSVGSEKSAWKCHIEGVIGNMKVTEIETEDIERVHRRATKRGPVVANRVVKLLSRMMTLAEKWKIRQQNSNPCVGVDMNHEGKRKMALDGAAVHRLGIALDAVEGLGTYEWQVCQYIRLLILTGARSGEIRKAKRADVGNAVERIAVPENKENDSDKTIPLGAAAAEIVRDLMQTFATPYLLPSPRRRGQPMGDPKALWQAIRDFADLPDGFHLHDLRHTFASEGIAQGLTLEQIGAILGHSKEATTELYGYLLDDPRRAAAERIGQTLADRLG